MATKAKKPFGLKAKAAQNEVMTIREQEFVRHWKWGLEKAANTIKELKEDDYYGEFIAQTVEVILEGYPENPIEALNNGYDEPVKRLIKSMMDLKADSEQIAWMVVFEIEHLAMRDQRELIIDRRNNPSYHRLLHAIKEIEKYHTTNDCEVNRLTRWALGDPDYDDVVAGWHPYNDENGEYTGE